MFYLIGCN